MARLLRREAGLGRGHTVKNVDSYIRGTRGWLGGGHTKGGEGGGLRCGDAAPYYIYIYIYVYIYIHTYISVKTIYCTIILRGFGT